MVAEARVFPLDDDEMADFLVSRTPEAYRLATWILRDPVAAEDAVQSAALSAWDARRRLRSAEKLRSWFTKMVVNQCRDELRQRSRRLPVTLVDAHVGEPGAELADRDEVGRAIGHLSPDEQVLIALRFGQDLTVPQIAEQLRLPEGTVKSRLHHSLDYLRSALAAERRLTED